MKLLVPMPVVLFLLLCGLKAFGDQPSVKPNPNSKVGQNETMDFEGENIIGEKQAPSLLLQTESEKLPLDSVLYLREDFNDFHVTDAKQHPRVFESAGGKKANQGAR